MIEFILIAAGILALILVIGVASGPRRDRARAAAAEAQRDKAIAVGGDPDLAALRPHDGIERRLWEKHFGLGSRAGRGVLTDEQRDDEIAQLRLAEKNQTS